MAEVQRNDGSRPGLPKSQVIGLILGAAFLLATLVLPAPGSMGAEAWAALGLMLLIATWWSTEAIPIPATALLPIVLVPALGLGTIGQATAPYANPIIFLFLGGFTLGLAMQRWNLHRRIALLTLKAVGDQPRRQIAGSLGVAGALPTIVMMVIVATVIIFLTEVTSNTATAAAFLPLLGALAMAQDVSPLLLTVPAAIAASCAFMMPVATPPNAIVFSSGHMQISDMIKAGFALNLMGIVVVTLITYGLLGLVFTL